MGAAKPLSKSRALAAKVIYSALLALKEAGGLLAYQDVINYVEQNTELNDWEKQPHGKMGYLRWWSTLQFHSVDCVKAGFLVKQKGIWYLTKDGDAALALGERGLLEAIDEGYRKWKQSVSGIRDDSHADDVFINDSRRISEIALEEVEQLARDEIKKYILAKTPYEFQDLVAALLRGMGYYTPYIAPPGKDSGIDIRAYRDPLGTQTPRITVQVKHRESTSPVSDIRQLMGILKKEGDIGIFVSSGGFTADAKIAVRSANHHIELIDLDRFISLWQEFYFKLSDEDKARLPLRSVYLLAPEE